MFIKKFFSFFLLAIISNFFYQNLSFANNETSFSTADEINQQALDNFYFLKIKKIGAGNGVIASVPQGIDCGTNCLYPFSIGTSITLEAIPDPGSAFLKWVNTDSCNTNTTCTVDLNQSKIVAALFIDDIPIPRFTPAVTSGSYPLSVKFYNTSLNTITNYEWDFNNDGIIDSTNKHPTHIFDSADTFTVTLNVSNNSEHVTLSKPNLITVLNPSSGTLYEIGPNKPYQSLHEVPLESAQPGDVFKVYAKPNQEPYYEKIFIRGTGTTELPITLIGVPDENGNRPILDGTNATSKTSLGNFHWNEDRQVILGGQYNNGEPLDHVFIKSLEVRGAKLGSTFTDDAGNVTAYLSNAAGIRFSLANTVTVDDVIVYGNENGIMSTRSSDITILHSHIYDNGLQVNSSSTHNLYLGGGAGSKVTMKFCHVGEQLNDGQQVKIRAELLDFAFNWIEGGRNSILDLVEEKSNGVSDAYVYGNVLIKVSPVHNNRIIHFGGDQSGSDPNRTLYFFNNSVIAKANSKVSFFSISREDTHVVANNNIFYQENPGNHNSTLYVTSKFSNITGNNNFLSNGIKNSSQLSNNMFGNHPGFISIENDNYKLSSSAVVANIVENFSPPQGYNLEFQYIKHTQKQLRPQNGNLDLGAFERD